MSRFYCSVCEDPLDDPEDDTCEWCRENEWATCHNCGADVPDEDMLCASCEEEFETEFDEEDMEFLRGPAL